MTTATNEPIRFLRLEEVCARTGFRRTFVYEAARRGTFPKPVKCGRAVRWVEHEVDAWMAAQMAERAA